VRTIVSFELRYNPYLKFVRWLRESGHLGRLHFARVQYLSRVTDWYSGWSWVRTRGSGRSHLLAAGCHAVDALRWCTGLEAAEVSAYHVRHTRGYQWPTTIAVNVRLGRSEASGESGVLGHVTSSTDFQMPTRSGRRTSWVIAPQSATTSCLNDAPTTAPRPGRVSLPGVTRAITDADGAPAIRWRPTCPAGPT
jgi:predicted dehydrogenase